MKPRSPIEMMVDQAAGYDQEGVPSVSIVWSKENKAFVASVPQLNGCVAHGDTRQEALKNAEEAILGWQKTAEEHGWKIMCTVTLKCPVCSKEKEVRKHWTDPEKTKVVLSSCTECSSLGNSAEIRYLDSTGKEIYNK